ncbi:zinc-binding dehydrogenase [Alteromonas sp. 5E99-2]|uniref:zinc-binding dehydrogenase n=1 Tax=Alteromonas sp. 5E99-2 TaxID=2817683 RepID=UPI001A99E06A|nr:zinc-binding dehydrogenase [Alteromonas sp. 5E99-2]MBO1254695.1 zinc-binding dehydrogenase [Alteromonas sp. 5E99-2]
MKAIIAKSQGGPENLQFYTVDEPTLNEGEIKIKVCAFGLNKAEMYNLKGGHGPFSGELALGIEAAGEVIHDPLGEFKPGQKVITAMGGMMFGRHGSYAPIICVKRTNIQAIDTNISYELLASLPQAYLTAWGAIDHSLKLQAGETLLVRGATSSIGLAAVVYAKLQGANVIAMTRKKENQAKLLEMGADLVVIDDGNVQQIISESKFKHADKAIELVGAGTLKDTMASLRRWGETVFVGFLGGPPVIEQFHLMNDLPNTIKLSFFGSGLLGNNELELKHSPIPKIADLVAKGEIPNIHAKTFESSDIQEAHKLLASNTALGKIVVTHG